MVLPNLCQCVHWIQRSSSFGAPTLLTHKGVFREGTLPNLLASLRWLFEPHLFLLLSDLLRGLLLSLAFLARLLVRR